MKFRVHCLWLCLVSLPALATGESLVVNVSGIKAGEGDVRVGVFDAEEAFPNGTGITGVELAADAETMRIEVTGLSPGRYAISVMQDLNGNKKLDTNFFGSPKEPYGFSGKWKSGRASFEDALIELVSGGSEISIRMK